MSAHFRIDGNRRAALVCESSFRAVDTVMPLSLNFELNDQDLARFQEAAERSRKAVEGKSAD